MTNKKTPLVSVIVLTYNNFSKIEANIQSIFAQDYPFIEIIIRDDSSTNLPAELINNLIDSAPKNITHISFSINSFNLGTVRNYRKAIESANGEYIIPLAADDIFISPNIISNIVHYMINNHLLICTSKRMGSTSKSIFPCDSDWDILKKHENNWLLKRIMFGNFISGSTLYFRKDILDIFSHKLLNEDFHLLEDYPLVFDLIDKNISIATCDIVSIIYGENGVSSKNGKRSKTYSEDVLTLYEKYINPRLNILHSNLVKKYYVHQYRKVYDEVNGSKTVKIDLDLGILLLVMKIFSFFRHETPASDRFQIIKFLENFAEKKCK